MGSPVAGTPFWENDVTQPVDGDPGAGSTFLDATQLANRTRFLLEHSSLALLDLRLVHTAAIKRFRDICVGLAAGPYDSNLWLAVGEDTGSGAHYAASTDGLSWVGYDYNVDGCIFRGVCHGGAGAYGAKTFVIVGNYFDGVPISRTRIWTAPDDAAENANPTIPELALTARLDGAAGALHGVAWNGTVFCAVGGDGATPRILTAADPTGVWTVRTAGSAYAGTFTRVIAVGTTLLAIGTNGEIQRSVDNGVTWTSVFRNAAYGTLNCISTAGYGIVVGTTGGGILRSTNDGAGWAEVVLPDLSPMVSAVGPQTAIGRQGNSVAIVKRDATLEKSVYLVSIDGGESWHYGGPALGNVVFDYKAAASDSARTLFVGGRYDETAGLIVASAPRLVHL